MKAEVIIHKDFVIDKIDPRIYGSFIEHLGRAVYGGIYEPTHETADEEGFRGDVLALVKKLGVPIVRYPGGNFVSGYRWEDGTGDKAKRPRRMELAWEAIETNEVGIDEFQSWAKKADSEVMMAVNLGTRGMEDAQALVEYCNGDQGTVYSEMRRKNGFEKPFGIKTWCLGNEMDGHWQMGRKTAEEYGKAAAETAKLMKLTDPSIELVLCGSSNYNIPTFGSWEMTSLDLAYDYVDYISLHQYYHNIRDKYEDFVGRSVHLGAFIQSVAAICDAIKAKKHARKTVNLSLDEWNVWYHSNGDTYEKWVTGAKRLEDVYNFEDALLVGCMLMTMQNHCDRVKMACMAQLVNVIAPIMTRNGGAAWVQTTFYPYLFASRYGRGEALQVIARSDSYTTSDKFTVPYLETSVIHDKKAKTVTVFAVNRSKDEDMALSLKPGGFENAVLTEHIELYHDDLKAVNTETDEKVSPKRRALPENDREVLLKKHSWNMLRYAY